MLSVLQLYCCIVENKPSLSLVCCDEEDYTCIGGNNSAGRLIDWLTEGSRLHTSHASEAYRFCFSRIHTTINFTRLSVTTEVGALYGRPICGWLGVVWAWSTHATVSSARGWLDVVVARKADLNWKL